MCGSRGLTAGLHPLQATVYLSPGGPMGVFALTLAERPEAGILFTAPCQPKGSAAGLNCTVKEPLPWGAKVTMSPVQT
jgi:hypothetical protein